MNTKSEKLLKQIQKRGIVRSRDFTNLGFPTYLFQRLLRDGHLERVGRGLYHIKDYQPSSEYSLAIAAKKIPIGVICLLSALRYHQLTMANPSDIWMAIPEKSRAIRSPEVVIRYVRWSASLFSFGIQTYHFEGVPVKMTTPARTIVDCFKYRNKVGLDFAIEALRDAINHKVCTRQEIHTFAKLCRVQTVIRPYMESIP
jgi:predicted transcriptional regulator of viral defense system